MQPRYTSIVAPLPSTVPFVGPEVQERTWRRVQGTDRRLKRVGDPDEIAGLVAYLASGESGYMTGSSLTIDGGMAL